MTARYGDKTEINNAVRNWGRKPPSVGEVTITASPVPAASVTPVTQNGVEFLVAKVTANTTLSFTGPGTAVAEIIMLGGGGGATYGGGGGGRLIAGTVPIASGPYPVVIGGGGAWPGTNGSNTTGFGLTAGGGNGATPSPIGPGTVNNAPGWLGGPSGISPAPGIPLAPVTFNGGSGTLWVFGAFGGGGAGCSSNGFSRLGNQVGPGTPPGGNGGAGFSVTWLASVEFVGGGGAGGTTYTTPGIAIHGGAIQNANGVANSAGGGGGGGAAGNGGSGVAYVRVRKFQP